MHDAYMRKTAKDAHHQPSVPCEVRHAVTNTGSGHPCPGPAAPRSARARARCVSEQAGNHGDSRSTILSNIGALTGENAVRRARTRSLPSWDYRLHETISGPQAQAPLHDASETPANSSSRDWFGGLGGDAPVLSMSSFTPLTPSGQRVRTPTGGTAHDRSRRTRHRGR